MKLEDQLFFSKEAADFLGITVQRLNKLVQEGKVKPLKKNASGAVFHIDELEKRKEEQKIFTEVKIGGKAMFTFDSRTKQEALNYATMMNVLEITENKLDPLFDELSKRVSIDVPIDKEEIIEAYCSFFSIQKEKLLTEYEKAYRAFLTLKDTDEVIKRGNKDYPPLLAQTEQAPRFLYIRGKKSLLYERRTVALVGSRQASDESKENTKRLAVRLGQNGITVISGLAKGIDVTAHVEALKWGFNTIAVIGTNLNQYYPSENKAVQLEIEKRGLVVSQFSPASQTQRWFFPLRNGVMSGLSLATVIMEAGETSGALKQADFALKQGRQVMIPKNALSIKTITWPARYVERGAVWVERPMDVIRILADNNIFKTDVKEVEPVQQTIEDYLNAASENNVIKKKTDWIEPIYEEN